MTFLKNYRSIILAVIGLCTLYFLLSSTSTTKMTHKQPISIGVTKKRESAHHGFEQIIKQQNEVEIERIHALGENATPSDFLRIAAIEKGGMISSTLDEIGFSEEEGMIIRERFYQMEVRGYYHVNFVTELSDSIGLSQKLQSFFRSIGASNYHDGLKNVNDHLSFSATDINNSLFSHIERFGSQTYGAVSNGRWSSIKHFFDDPDVGIIRLNEQQAGPGGTTKQYLPKEFNEQINGHPARYTVEVAANGQVLTSLDWVNGKNWYSMYMQQNAGTDDKAKAYFFELANSLPDPEAW